MKSNTTELSRDIDEQTALRLCLEIREEKRHRFFGFGAMQCWGCVKFSKGDPAKMCLNNKPGHRGCDLINKRYERLQGQA